VDWNGLARHATGGDLNAKALQPILEAKKACRPMAAASTGAMNGRIETALFPREFQNEQKAAFRVVTSPGSAAAGAAAVGP